MPLAPILLRYGFPALAAIGVLFGVYTKGRSDCAVKHAQEEAKAADDWADRLVKSAAEAYRQGKADAKEDAEEKEEADAIVEELPPVGVCVTADAVDRVRQLQDD